MEAQVEERPALFPVPLVPGPMDREEERVYAAALAEVTAPGAVDLDELAGRRTNGATEPGATSPVEVHPGQEPERQPKMEPDRLPAPTDAETEAAPKRTLRFADEAEDVKPSKRARFASPPPSVNAEAGPSRETNFASSGAKVPPKRARFVSPPPVAFSNDTGPESPERGRIPSPQLLVKQETGTSASTEPPVPETPPPPTQPGEPDPEAQRKRARFE